jgi:hypothetical protein
VHFNVAHAERPLDPVILLVAIMVSDKSVTQKHWATLSAIIKICRKKCETHSFVRMAWVTPS